MIIILILVVGFIGIILHLSFAGAEPEVKVAGRNTQGVKIINIDDKSRVASIAIMPHSDETEDEEFEDEIAEEGEPASEEAPVTPDSVE